MDEQMRKKFDAWFPYEPGETISMVRDVAWEAWQVSAALSQPAESFIGESAQADFEDDMWTFKMRPGYSVGAGFYRISYIGLADTKAAA